MYALNSLYLNFPFRSFISFMRLPTINFQFRFWLWWLTQIVLLLRCEAQLQIDVRQEITSTYANETAAIGGRRDAEQLGIPRCDSHYDCVFNGYCIKDSDGYGRCLCPKSCPSSKSNNIYPFAEKKLYHLRLWKAVQIFLTVEYFTETSSLEENT